MVCGILPQTYWWHDKYRPRKPRYFNRVKTGYDWNKYNQTHYDHDNPPPKTVQVHRVFIVRRRKKNVKRGGFAYNFYLCYRIEGCLSDLNYLKILSYFEHLQGFLPRG